MRAIISDIHGNLEALQAVLSDIEEQEVEEIICLGDLVGYGPDPKGCLDLAKDFDVVLQGNHESALMVDTNGIAFNVTARRSLDWTRRQLDLLDPEHKEQNAERWDFLGSLGKNYEDGDVFFVHASPREPTTEYIYARDIYHEEKLKKIFQEINHVCFVGHTHVAGIWTNDMVYVSSHEANYLYRLTGKKTIINVGSVGQPRDGDVRASYVLQDGDMVEFRRVEYPVQETSEKIRSIEDLDEFLADRLLDGR